MNIFFKTFLAKVTLITFFSPIFAFAGRLSDLPGITGLDEAIAENWVENCNAKLYYSAVERCFVVSAPACGKIRVTSQGTHMGTINEISTKVLDKVKILKGTVDPLVGNSFEGKLIVVSKNQVLLKWDREDLCTELTEIDP